MAQQLKLLTLRFFSVLAGIYRTQPKEIEGVQYIRSKRGTDQVLFEGNAYTPNEKSSNESGSRTWKCSMYYKFKCKSRITTRHVGSKEYVRPSNHQHNHQDLHPVKTILE